MLPERNTQGKQDKVGEEGQVMENKGIQTKQQEDKKEELKEVGQR
jgi:hypothetical protein